ncbi:MAG: 3-deoxy-D-manno-octulosonic acid transferase [Xanthobacteraceae bacterium]|nr:3-deoxy-D-manno-octulosonic acid transferase [Xanthobacteraceae bacterium]MBV9631773.1 3-deoxy-D-manno-octulosonic acid transferase [Xanthobacteraceae bacterium]
MSDGTPAALALYRLATRAATPFANQLLQHRLKRGKEHAVRLPERRGESEVARPTGGLVWVHGASVGELLAALPLVEQINTYGLPLLVTSGTVTSAAIARQRLPAGVIHQFIPLDTPDFVTRFLDHWQPQLALFVESDLWPNLITACGQRKIPLVLINGRLSERSYARWKKLMPSLIAALLANFDLCLVRSSEDAKRYVDLGARRVTTVGNLKLDVPPLPVDESKRGQLAQALAGRPVLAAASTHPGEDEQILQAHRALRARYAQLLTLIVPRHPERGAAIAQLISTAGLSACQRSTGQLPGTATDIYVCDTLGELGVIYSLAPIVFMGGSFIPHGGQNPIEAIKLGAAVLHGPFVSNFAETYGALDAARGAELVTDADRLAQVAGHWLKDERARQQILAAGQKTVDALGGALARTLSALDPYLSNLRRGAHA